jgi:hypothetical protein
MTPSLNLSLRLLVVHTILSGLCHAFTSPSHVLNNQLSVLTSARPTTTSLLLAKKRRRRKQTDDGANSPSTTLSESDELPDFELEEEMVETPKKKIITNPDEITPAMMGIPGKPARSVSALIKDRALESKFEFEDPGDEALPDLTELAKGISPQPRGQLRKNQKIGAGETKEEEWDPLANIPQFLDEKGEVSFVKVRERIVLIAGRADFSYSLFFGRFWNLVHGSAFSRW